MGIIALIVILVSRHHKTITVYILLRRISVIVLGV